MYMHVYIHKYVYVYAYIVIRGGSATKFNGFPSVCICVCIYPFMDSAFSDEISSLKVRNFVTESVVHSDEISD